MCFPKKSITILIHSFPDMDARTLKKIRTYCLETYASTKSLSHDMGHIERVRTNALTIVDVLHVTHEVNTQLLEAACYLHDIVTSRTGNGTVLSHLYNHIFEKQILKKYLPDIIALFHLSLQDSRILVTAIVNHPYSTPYRVLNTNKDLYSKILQDADTLDYVSLERQARFETSHPMLSVIVRPYLLFVRRNIRYFLNFPKLVPCTGTTRV